MNGADDWDTEIVLGMFALCLIMVLWAALVLWAQMRMRSVRRLKAHAMRRAVELNVQAHYILVDPRRARATLVYVGEGGEERRLVQQWSNRLETRTPPREWYSGGTETEENR